MVGVREGAGAVGAGPSPAARSIGRRPKIKIFKKSAACQAADLKRPRLAGARVTRKKNFFRFFEKKSKIPYCQLARKISLKNRFDFLARNFSKLITPRRYLGRDT